MWHIFGYLPAIKTISSASSSISFNKPIVQIVAWLWIETSLILFKSNNTAGNPLHHGSELQFQSAYRLTVPTSWRHWCFIALANYRHFITMFVQARTQHIKARWQHSHTKICMIFYFLEWKKCPSLWQYSNRCQACCRDRSIKRIHKTRL